MLTFRVFNRFNIFFEVHAASVSEALRNAQLHYNLRAPVAVEVFAFNSWRPANIL